MGDLALKYQAGDIDLSNALLVLVTLPYDHRIHDKEDRVYDHAFQSLMVDLWREVIKAAGVKRLRRSKLKWNMGDSVGSTSAHSYWVRDDGYQEDWFLALHDEHDGNRWPGCYVGCAAHPPNQHFEDVDHGIYRWVSSFAIDDLANTLRMCVLQSRQKHGVEE